MAVPIYLSRLYAVISTLTRGLSFGVIPGCFVKRSLGPAAVRSLAARDAAGFKGLRRGSAELAVKPVQLAFAFCQGVHEQPDRLSGGLPLTAVEAQPFPFFPPSNGLFFQEDPAVPHKRDPFARRRRRDRSEDLIIMIVFRQAAPKGKLRRFIMIVTNSCRGVVNQAVSRAKGVCRP